MLATPRRHFLFLTLHPDQCGGCRSLAAQLSCALSAALRTSTASLLPAGPWVSCYKQPCGPSPLHMRGPGSCWSTLARDLHRLERPCDGHGRGQESSSGTGGSGVLLVRQRWLRTAPALVQESVVGDGSGSQQCHPPLCHLGWAAARQSHGSPAADKPSSASSGRGPFQEARSCCDPTHPCC